MTTTTLAADPAAVAAIEAFAAQESGDWHVFQQEEGNVYLLGGVWGEPAGSGTWGCKRCSHIEAAGQPLPTGAPGAEKVAVFAGSDAVEAFPWTRDHFRAGKPDSNHRTFLVLYPHRYPHLDPRVLWWRQAPRCCDPQPL